MVDRYLVSIRYRSDLAASRLVGYSTVAQFALHIARRMLDSVNGILTIKRLCSGRLVSGRIDRQLLRLPVLALPSLSRLVGA